MLRGVLVGALMLSACGGASDPQAPEDLGTLLSRDPAATVVLEYFSGITEPSSRLISSADQWARVWAAIYQNVEPKPARPAIDFTSEVLVLVALGEVSGVSLSIEGVRRFERGVVAEILTESYSDRCLVLTAMGQPVHVVRIARPAGQTVLTERTHRIRECD